MICRNCGAGLEADKINTSLGVVTCSHCGSLHNIPDAAPDNALDGSTVSTKEAHSSATKPKRVEVALPKRFKVQRAANALEVTWSAGGIFPGIVISIIAGGFAYAAITSGVLPLLIVSVGLLYFAATRAFNKHRIRVDAARLEVTQGPLPCPGTRKLDASDIVQLYATEHESRSETENGGNRQVNVRKHYRLLAKTQNNGRVTILSGLGDPHQALWLEQEIEGLLGINDKSVAGEYQR